MIFLQKPNKPALTISNEKAMVSQVVICLKSNFIFENLILTRLVYWNFWKLMNHEIRFYYRGENT